MSVHIDELHTDVIPMRERGQGPTGPDSGDTAEEHLAQARRAAYLAARVAAEGFDD
jgi:hypothetical protein